MLLTIFPATEAPVPKPRPPTALCASYRDQQIISVIVRKTNRRRSITHSRTHASGLQLEAILFPRFRIRYDCIVATWSDDGGRHRAWSVRHRCESKLVMRGMWWWRIAVLILLILVRVVSIRRRWRIGRLIRLLAWILVGWCKGILLM